MYKVNVQNLCSCFLKSGMPETQEFQTKDEAKAEAESMLGNMKEKFCKKHEFSLIERFGDFTIYIKPRK